jgi:hypothetical protein
VQLTHDPEFKTKPSAQVVHVGVDPEIVQTLHPVPQLMQEKVDVNPNPTLHASHFPAPLVSQFLVAKQLDPHA